MTLKRVLTIAGSDSGGGAGIQADLKTFAALGVHGMTAITAITAQNTMDVMTVQDLETDIIEAQIQAIVEDIGVDAIKTGMLYSEAIITVVSQHIAKCAVPSVIDPVMIAKSGARLLKEQAINALINELLPHATVVTPNALEAETLSGIQISNLDDAKAAAQAITKLGPQATVVKGGHISGKEAIDIVYYQNKFTLLKAKRITTDTTHGTGCSFASAIAAELAKGSDLIKAIDTAKHFVHTSIKHGLHIGHGAGPVNPMAQLYNNAAKYQVLTIMTKALDMFTASSTVSNLVPESQINLVMALPHASSPHDVMGVPGRIVKLGNRVHASSCPAFGASSHVARTVLVAMEHDASIQSAMNIRYTQEIIDRCHDFGWITSSYNRREEPPEIKHIDGRTTTWGAQQAIKAAGQVPHVIYHLGDWGKEPMIILFGKTPSDIVHMAIQIADTL